MPYTVTKTNLPEVLILQPKVFGDARGFFFESFNQKRFEELTGVKSHFVQDNHSRSARGVLRGLHFQKQHPQGKLLSVSHGKVFDVAADILRAIERNEFRPRPSKLCDWCFFKAICPAHVG